MPWKEQDTLSLRLEFVTLARVEGGRMSRLCRRFGISRKTGYKWLERFQREGAEGLQDRSRRPHLSPRRTPPATEEAILALRGEHPVWGGRKIRAVLLRQGQRPVPSPSTITEILRRHGQLDPRRRCHRSWQRFEAAAPNELWQMDFKGHFPLLHGRCHPLTLLDDHSRYALGLEACGDETARTVQACLRVIFRRYGLPQSLLMDNGSPWAGAATRRPYTQLTAWIIRLGITVRHSRPRHPQTLGKDERFHRTLQAEVLRDRLYKDLDQCQRSFDRWRCLYNFERPHQALDLAVPAERYRESPRSFPESLPAIEYPPNEPVRKVQRQGELYFRGRCFQVPRAFRGHPVALRPTRQDGLYHVFFCHQKIAEIDLKDNDA